MARHLLQKVQYQVHNPSPDSAAYCYLWAEELNENQSRYEDGQERAVTELLSNYAQHIAMCTALRLFLQSTIMSFGVSVRSPAAYRMMTAACAAAERLSGLFVRVANQRELGEAEVAAAIADADALAVVDPEDAKWLGSPTAAAWDALIQLLLPYAAKGLGNLFKRVASLMRERRRAAGFIPAAKISKFSQAGSVPGPGKPKPSRTPKTEWEQFPEGVRPARGGRAKAGPTGPGSDAARIRTDMQELRPGAKSNRAKLVSSEADLQALHEKWTAGGEPISDSTRVGPYTKLPDGTRVGLRPTSSVESGGGPTIDVFFPDGQYVRVHIK